MVTVMYVIDTPMQIHIYVYKMLCECIDIGVFVCIFQDVRMYFSVGIYERTDTPL